MTESERSVVGANQFFMKDQREVHIDLKGNSFHHYNFFKQKFDYELKAPNQVILELGNYDLKTRDLILLIRKNWLNDMIINYFGLILSRDSFKAVARKMYPQTNLYEQQLLILNTFVSINVGYLEKAYFEYKRTKLAQINQSCSKSQSDDSHFGLEPKARPQAAQYRLAKEQYLRWVLVGRANPRKIETLAGGKLDYLRRKNKFFEKDCLFVPFVKNVHWTLFVLEGFREYFKEVLEYYLDIDRNCGSLRSQSG